MMKKSLLRYWVLTLVVSLAFISKTEAQSWTTYDGSTLPATASPAFTTSNSAGSPTTEIVSDPDITNNDLLHVSTPATSDNQQWRQALSMSENYTVVVRAKASAGVGSGGSFVFDLDLDVRTGSTPNRWQLRILKTNKFSVATGTADATNDLNADVTEWNTYRFVWKNSGTETYLYVNESPDPVYSGAGSSSTGSNSYFRFGDGYGSNNIDTYFDWVIWDVTGGYTPTESPLPSSLVGATIDWNGATSSDWATASNWTGGIPTSTSNVSIPSVGTSPVVSGDAAVNNLEIATGASLTVSSGASLAILGAFSGDGTVTATRNTTGNKGYSILGSPIQSKDISDLSANYKYAYDETTASYTAASGSMTPGVGYFIGFNAATPSVSLTGTPKSGAVSTAVTNSEAGSGSGFNLVANPYLASISISSFLSNTNNSTVTTGAVYLWNDGGSNVGGNRGGDYVTANSIGTIGTTDLSDGVAGQKTSPTNVNIGSFQGFFIKTSVAGDVQFTADMQVTTADANSDDNFYRKASSDEKQLLKLTVSGNGLFNETLIGLTPNATMGIDYAMDAEKIAGNEHVSFYSLIGDKKFAIQGLPQVESTPIQVQLGMDLKEAGEYVLSINDFSGFDDNVSVSILDKETGEIYPISKGTSIAFTSTEVSNSKRFEVVFTAAKTLATDLQNSKNLTVLGKQNGVTIQYASNKAETVNIYSLDGRVVFSDVVNFSNNQALVGVALSKHRIYVLKVNNQTAKFIIK
jgi:hypothetical protein